MAVKILNKKRDVFYDESRREFYLYETWAYQENENAVLSYRTGSLPVPRDVIYHLFNRNVESTLSLDDNRLESFFAQIERDLEQALQSEPEDMFNLYWQEHSYNGRHV